MGKGEFIALTYKYISELKPENCCGKQKLVISLGYGDISKRDD